MHMYIDDRFTCSSGSFVHKFMMLFLLPLATTSSVLRCVCFKLFPA